MQWLIQSSGPTLDALDRNTAPLVEAIRQRGIPLFAVGVGSTSRVTDLEEIDLSLATMFYGSNRLVELAPFLASPGAFFKKEWFDPGYPIGKNPFFLNTEQTRITAAQLRRDWDQGTHLHQVGRSKSPDWDGARTRPPGPMDD